MDLVRYKVLREFTVFSSGCWRRFKPGEVAEMERKDAAPYEARGLIAAESIPAVKVLNIARASKSEAVK